MDRDKVDLLIHYALLVAARQDEYFERQLGPIHLVKYVYLADLLHAERHGETFTGADWRFYKFGPWDADVYARIEPTVRAIGADEHVIASTRFEEDRKRWSVSDEDFDDVERRLPIDVALRLRALVRKFATDTAGLLHFVYNTRPMLEAAPGERLVFTLAEPEDPGLYRRSTAAPPRSVKEEKRRAERLRQARETIKQKLAASGGKRRLVHVAPPPRYDEVFAEGLAWLDADAGAPLSFSSADLHVDAAVWTSPSRRDRHDG